MDKERMAAYQRGRRVKLAALKTDPKIMAAPMLIPPVIIARASLSLPTGACNGCDALHALEERVRRLENPDEVSRRQALKGRPNELYGA